VASDGFGGADPVHNGHRDIHKDQVRLMGRVFLYGFLAVGSLGYHLVTIGAEDVLQGDAHEERVVGYKDFL
jgi:hypothetical protein